MESDNKKKNKKSKAKVETEKRKSLLSYILGGKAMTDFMVKQLPFFALLFVIIFCFITNRYICSKQLTEMEKLKKELVELNTEQILLTTRITTISRQSNIEKLLRNKGIDLTKCQTSVYQINK